MPSPRMLLAAAVLAAGLTGCSGGTGTVELNGQGATFVEPVMKVWTNHYLEEKTGGRVRINYQGTGSGAGIQQLINQTTDFGCSDAPMNRKQLDDATTAGGAVVHVPLVIGAVVPVYNLEGVSRPLHFTGPVLADIYLGKVTKWNDPALKELNPGVPLPDLGIQPVFRSDSSGTSNVFTEYLAKVSPEFKAKVGASTSPAFPPGVGIGKPKNDGVAGHISNSPGAIGYVELTYALDKKAQFGAVRNRAGRFVLADLASITAAAAASLAEKPADEPYSLHDLTYSLTDPAGEMSYPIAAMSYAVLYAKQPDAAKGKALVEFLHWCVSPEGQKLAEQRNYAALPADLAAKIAAKLDTIAVGKQ